MPATFTNLSFETPADAGAGGVPNQVGEIGLADSWVMVEIATAYEIASLGGVSHEARAETFGIDWTGTDAFLSEFADADLTVAGFDSPTLEHYEDFEEGWDTNEGFTFFLASVAAASFNTTSDAYEDFEREWSSNESNETTFVPADLTAALFDATPEAFEDFEDGWSGLTGPGDFLFAFVALDLAAASFDGADPEAYEDFEEVNDYEQAVTVIAVTAGDYDVVVNGRDHVYTATGPETVSDIRDALQSLLDSSPVGVTTSAVSSDQLLVGIATVPAADPPWFSIGATGPLPNRISVAKTDESLYWTQSGKMRTI